MTRPAIRRPLSRLVNPCATAFRDKRTYTVASIHRRLAPPAPDCRIHGPVAWRVVLAAMLVWLTSLELERLQASHHLFASVVLGERLASRSLPYARLPHYHVDFEKHSVDLTIAASYDSRRSLRGAWNHLPLKVSLHSVAWSCGAIFLF